MSDSLQHDTLYYTVLNKGSITLKSKLLVHKQTNQWNRIKATKVDLNG